MNIYQYLYDNSKANNVLFELSSGELYSYKKIDQESAKVANWILENNWPAGSRIVSRLPKSIDAVSLYLGTIRAGMIYVPISNSYTTTEAQRIINNCNPCVIVEEGKLPWRDFAKDFQTVDVLDSCPATIIYTSGTTGPSKGAVISHGNLIANMLSFDKILPLDQSDVLIHCLPIFHAHGLLIALHAQMFSGSKSFWLDKFDIDACLKFLPDTTVMMAVPTIYHRLSNHSNLNKEMCSKVKAFISASAPLPESVASMFYEKTNKEIVQRYGTTEALVVTSNPIINPTRGTVGKPIPGMQLRLNSNDEIEIKGPSLFLGYWNKDPNSHLTKDGWFCTSDQGYIDALGHITITGRTKDIVISGGFKISPIEVETVAESCTGVSESAVIGVLDNDIGEKPVIYVVGECVDFDQLIESFDQQLAKFKRPSKIFLVESLPKNDLGKIQKNVLRHEFTNNITDRIICSI